MKINSRQKKTDSLISSDKIRQLRTAGVPVIMPTYIPDSFQFTNFNFNDSTESYEAIYQGANRCHFGIEGSKAGWGADIDVSHQWVINTQIIGEVTLMHITRGSSSGKPELQAWLQPDVGEKKEIIEGFPYAAYRLYFICKNTLFSPQEAIKIVENLEIRDN